MLSHSEYRQALIAWVNEPTRDLAVDLPNAIKTKLEKKFLKMHFHDDARIDGQIADLQVLKDRILQLKQEYPEVN